MKKKDKTLLASAKPKMTLEERKLFERMSKREREDFKKKRRTQEKAVKRNIAQLKFIAVAKAPCGCCNVEMYFKNRESAVEAFKKAGLNYTSITDDAGQIHESVDTFYGFWEKGKEDGRGLDHLMKLVTGKKKWL